MVATHIGASNTKEYFEKWIKYLKLKKTKWQKFKMAATHKGASKQTRGIQTYRECCLTFFYQLTVMSVIALLNAIAEAVSNIRESL